MTAVFPRRFLARSSRILASLLRATALCAQDKDAVPLPWNDAVPPCSPEHVARALEESTRHGAWVDVALADGSKMESWVVYPERKDKAPVLGLCGGNDARINATLPPTIAAMMEHKKR